MLEKARELFKNYVDSFDHGDERIDLKYYHSLEVEQMSILIADKMGLSKEDRDLAALIGLYHDFGRFAQIRDIASFNDFKYNHGILGAESLEKTGILKELGLSKEDQKIVYKAIVNHNALKIEDGLNERELFFAKLIRDADKIDIFRVVSRPEFIELPTPICVENLFNKKAIRKEDRENKSDYFLCIIAFIYDINFDESIDILLKTKNIDNYLKRTIISDQNRDLFLEIVKIVERDLKNV